MDKILCPVCNKHYSNDEITHHVEKCLFLHSFEENKKIERKSDICLQNTPKRMKLAEADEPITSTSKEILQNNPVPLAEKMRPNVLEEYVGQNHILGKDKMLRQLLVKNDIPSMIFWGPPGSGKTSLANIISNICKNNNRLRFVKLSATMSGINDVKEAVKIACNKMKFKRKTVLFMDEIHRFNKLQQDVFLPHIENGTLILIGATTENPSFSLNSALLSRCRVICFEKLTVDDIIKILLKAAEMSNISIIQKDGINSEVSNQRSLIINAETLKWLAEICDGDARIALNSFQLTVQSKEVMKNFGNKIISLDDVKDGIKRSHILYDKKGEEHYNMISALHKSIRASDDNATLYWLTRMIKGGEDPLYICRRLIRIAGEDIGLADPQALPLTTSCLTGCQQIGMPECDVLLAECAVYLARAPKSTEVYKALIRCKECIDNHKGPLPGVPLHLRNAPTKLMADLGYAKGYNTSHKHVSGLTYMPEGMEEESFFEK